MGFFWPDSEQKRSEYLAVKRNNPAIAQSVYQCMPGQREGGIFREKDFAYFDAPEEVLRAIEERRGVMAPAMRAFVMRGHQLTTAWDTAFEATSSHDPTVGIVGLFVPCAKYHCGEREEIFGACDPHFDVLILDILRERLEWGDLVSAFRRMHRTWEPTEHVIEKRGSGINLYQSMSSIGINVLGVEAVESKKNRVLMGVGAGSVQGWFSKHRVLFPRRAPWLEKLKQELKDFTGAKDASDDQVDAITHLVNRAIVLSVGAGLLPADWSPDRVDDMMFGDGALMPSSLGLAGDPLQMLSYIGLSADFRQDPFAETCGRCIHNEGGFCDVQKRAVASIDSCMEFEPRVAAA